MRHIFAWITAFYFCVPALGGDSVFPITQFYPDPVGMVYPSLSVAAGVNPAALASSSSGSALQVGFSPGSASESERFFASVANASRQFGFGMGWQGTQQNGNMNHNGFVGVGTLLGKVAAGISLRAYDMNAGVSPRVDVGILAQLKLLDLGLVFYDLQGVSRLGVGVGKNSGRFNLEGNVLLPPFSNMAAGYLFTVSAQMGLDLITAYFRTSYNTYSLDFSHSLGLGVAVSKRVTLAAQYSMPARVHTAVTVRI